MTAGTGANAAKEEATRRQSEASEPGVSAWVSANAGSGKTHVLAQRVIRLLLAGTPPARILCLTYTKAAAANMANRVLAILGRWVTLTDAELDGELLRIDRRPPDAARRALARRLFAAALETPGGLKIQTIHAFCGALLHQFPFEAGVAAGFSELDEAAGADLMARIRTELVMTATAAPDSRIGRALARLMEEESDSRITELIAAAVAARGAVLALGADPSARTATVAATLGLPPGATRAAVEAEILSSAHLPRFAWAEVAARLGASSKATDRKRGAALAVAAAAGSDAEALPAYLDFFLKSDGTPRTDRDLITNEIRAAEPDMAEHLVLERDRVAGLIEQLRAASVLERTEAALTLGAAACARYEGEKAARGLLDFDDLVRRTAELLNRVPASWVHFKLDRGVDHVLMDEAQDTSPEQWAVVKGLVADFFAGAGARGELRRTLFVVGDEKQSIFSFQGADPRTFGAMHQRIAGEAGATGFRDVKLPHSFRSAPGVLEAVDRVFAGEEARRGLGAEGLAPVHAAIRADAPAFIEIWPTVIPAEKPEVDDWRRPLDEVPADDPVNTLALRIAAFVRWGVRTRLAMPSRGGRPMQARDVLILVRRRGKLFEAVIRALKGLGEGIEVAGADRLVVADHIAALDLMALGDALLSPDDDLALAGVLKSPLFGFDDDDLMALCPGRPGRLIDALEGSPDPRWAPARARLDRWRDEAVRLRPFDFYGRVLARDGGRRAMLARLGAEAVDVLDEFMTLARTYEAVEPATLAGFLAFLRRGGAETKRDMESGRNEVRVMTVHGAKGLEAPLVILADTVDLPRPRTAGGLLMVSRPDGAEVPVFAPRKAEDPPPLAVARAAAVAREQEEYRRLLYVALTRAEDALVVCGAETRAAAKGRPHARPEGCWYDLVHDALAEESVAVEAPYGPVLRWRKADAFAPAADAGVAPNPSAPVAAPAFGPLPAEHTVRLLRPSQADAGPPPPDRAEPVPAGAATGGLDALLRGDLIHRLLAGLADLPAEERRPAGLRLLRHVAALLDESAHAALLDEALGVLDHAAFATGDLGDLFGPGSRAEVPVAGRWRAAGGAEVRISGRIDRLAMSAERVLIADFKTDRIPPGAGEAGPAHAAQLALYGEALRRAFPGRSVAACIVYTRGPLVHRLGPDALAAALAGLGEAPA